MSVYKVERRVDTIIMEMDSSVAEALLELLGNVIDHTTMTPLDELFDKMDAIQQIRFPSELHKVVIDEANDQIHLVNAHGNPCTRPHHGPHPYQRLVRDLT